MNTLFTITGLPYAGKTTLRNEIVKRFNLATVSIDELNTKNGAGIDSDKPITQEDWDKVYFQAYELLKKCLREGKNVVFDGGSLLLHEREAQREIAEEFGAKRILIYVNTPLELIKERWLRNQTTHQRGHVREDDFKNALKMWQEPTAEENPIIFRNESNLIEWIAQNIE